MNSGELGSFRIGEDKKEMDPYDLAEMQVNAGENIADARIRAMQLAVKENRDMSFKMANGTREIYPIEKARKELPKELGERIKQRERHLETLKADIQRVQEQVDADKKAL